MSVQLFILLAWYNLLAGTITVNDCKFKVSKNVPAGPVEEPKASCQYSLKNQNGFFYNISWKHPRFSPTVIKSYRVTITYKSPSRKYCFKVLNSTDTFIFDRNLGFQSGVDMKFSVTSEPVVFQGKGYSFHMYKGEKCPGPMELENLPNAVVKLRRNHSFECKFKHKTFFAFKILWYFSKDTKTCNLSRVLLNNHTAKYVLSNDNKTLKVVNTSMTDIGCYILVVYDNKKKLEKKGYINIEEEMNIEDTSDHTIIVIITLMIFSIVLVFVLLFICKNKTSRLELFTGNFNQANRTVYISHCLEDSKKNCLTQLAMLLNDANLNIIIDIYSIVAINNAGGISNWITRSIDLCSKIIVIVDKKYLKILKSFHDEKNNEDTRIQQILTEYNCYINKGADSIIVLYKGVEREELTKFFNKASFHPLEGFETNNIMLKSLF